MHCCFLYLFIINSSLSQKRQVTGPYILVRTWNQTHYCLGPFHVLLCVHQKHLHRAVLFWADKSSREIYVIKHLYTWNIDYLSTYNSDISIAYIFLIYRLLLNITITTKNLYMYIIMIIIRIRTYIVNKINMLTQQSGSKNVGISFFENTFGVACKSCLLRK